MGKTVSKETARSMALRGKPIEKYGLKFRAIPMERYEEWQRCKKVWLARQSTFPAFAISVSFLEALFRMDIRTLEETGKPGQCTYTAMYGIGMALGMESDCVQSGQIAIAADEETREIKAICVKTEDGGQAEITPGMFNTIRKIVAWMQGEETPDETLNDELLDAEQALAERDAPKLKYDLTDLIAAVAAGSGQRIKDVLEWSILEFETMRRAIDRGERHLICGIGATNGCKWEGGNPCPSWCFDREKEGSSALISASKFGQTKTRRSD